ncbi:MAG: DUF262 domain-containing protein [Pseudomonadales bacterium]
MPARAAPAKAAPTGAKRNTKKLLIANPNLGGFDFPDDQQESEDDLGKVSFRGAVVTNVDWTIESINLQMDKGTVDVQPSFQRRAAWDTPRKSRLIESIIVGMPVPNLVLAENKEHRGRFIVIDGKQRLLAIQEFIEGGYRLSGLDLRDDLNQKRYQDLDRDDREAFENSTIRTTLIKNWEDEKFLWAAFYRLNVGSLPLSPQELRKALIGGQLIDEIEMYLSRSHAFQAVFGDQLDKRMRDSELVLRFLAFDRNLGRYRGDFKKFLDDTAKYYEADWNRRRSEAYRGFQRLDTALETSYEIFHENAFKKWLGYGHERVMNRAIFDCMARYFSDTDIANQAVLNRAKVIAAYKKACDDPQFREAIERTTKTVAATEARLYIWGSLLAKALGLSLNTETWRII